MRKLVSRAFVLWLPLVVALTGVFGFIYIAVQQNYRQSVNDPQIQMAEDDALRLAQGEQPASLVPRGISPIDLRTSLATWIAVYNSSGMPLESSAVLDGAPPRLPSGLFDTNTWVPHKIWQAPSGVETRVTWQPRPDIRQAVVLVQFKTPISVGYVAVGRSMHLIEKRISDLTYHAAVAWSATALASLFVISAILMLG